MTNNFSFFLHCGFYNLILYRQLSIASKTFLTTDNLHDPPHATPQYNFFELSLPMSLSDDHPTKNVRNFVMIKKYPSSIVRAFRYRWEMDESKPIDDENASPLHQHQKHFSPSEKSNHHINFLIQQKSSTN